VDEEADSVDIGRIDGRSACICLRSLVVSPSDEVDSSIVRAGESVGLYIGRRITYECLDAYLNDISAVSPLVTPHCLRSYPCTRAGRGVDGGAVVTDPDIGPAGSDSGLMTPYSGAVSVRVLEGKVSAYGVLR